jgi:hypothetical protein
MLGKVGDIASVAIAVAVSVLFVGVTFARWPIPARLRNFHTEFVNPLGSLHGHHQGIIRVTSN